MPDLPETLPALLRLWAERHTDEVTTWDVAHVGLRLPDTIYRVPLVPETGLSAEVRYVVEGHARVCIERAGYLVDTRTFQANHDEEVLVYDASAIHTWSDEKIETSTCPTLAAALVRLLLSLPRESAPTGSTP